ncbi:DUF6294 family protein [Mycobacterium sp.]|uniref:DUF6294 family protein n=1 Tax=Mycobacterium sp. TaxID=1785 RepID=UPI003D148D15
MTDHFDAETAESSPPAGEQACKHVPPVDAESEMAPLAESARARVAQKTLSWRNAIRVGDCTMEGINLVIEANGTAYFNASIGSSGDDDAWVIRNGVSLIGSNGTVLFTSGKLVSPTCPQGAESNWSAMFNFPATLYGSIASARINGAHC